MRGRFITFEGVEGSGKSTLIERLAQHLRDAGHDVITTREPGGTNFGRELRAMLLRRGSPPQNIAEAFLMLADRSEHVARVVRPALEAGRIVLCDRYGDSTIAYQGGGSGLDRAMLAQLNAWATGGLAPDLTLLLDLPAEDSFGRLSVRSATPAPDRFESEPIEFHQRVRATYLDLAAHEPARWLVLDARRDPDAIFREASARTDGLLADRAG